LNAGYSFRDQRKNRAKENCEERRHEDNVVEQKSRFAADHGIELGLLLEQISAIGDKAEGAEQDDGQKAEKKSAHGSGRKRMDRRKNPGAGKKRAENRQAEGDDDQR